MRRTSWTVGIAAPIAVLIAMTGMGFAAAAVATPSGSESAAAATNTTKTKATKSRTRTRTTKVKTTKVKTTKSKTGKTKNLTCKKGCILVSDDFETGNDSWVGPEGEVLGVTTEAAANGVQALESAWISQSAGPSTTITDPKLLSAKNRVFLATVQVRKTWTSNGKPVVLTVQGATDVRFQAGAVSGQWQTLMASFIPVSTTITIGVREGAGDPCMYYPAVMQAVSVDDFRLGIPATNPSFTVQPTTTTKCPTQTPTQTPTPTQTTTWCAGCKVLTSTFVDEGTGGWKAVGDVSLVGVKGAGESGSYALLAKGVSYSGRPALGVDASILDARSDLVYEVAARVRLASGEPATGFQMYVTGAQKVWPTTTTVTADAWTTVRTRFVIGSGLATLDQLVFSLGQQPIQSNCGNPVAVNVLMDNTTLSVPSEQSVPNSTSFPKNCGTSTPRTSAAAAR